jgi:Domain of unknown function (DUF4333)
VKRLLATCSIGLCAVAVGCGTKKLNIDDAERTMSKRLGLQEGTKVKVDCPEDVEIKKGDTFNCRATAEGKEPSTVKVTQLDDDGRVRFEVVPR